MTDHIKAARSIWGESAILPLAELERFYAIAYRHGMERAAEICEAQHEEGRPGDYAYVIRAAIQKATKEQA